MTWSVLLFDVGLHDNEGTSFPARGPSAGAVPGRRGLLGGKDPTGRLLLFHPCFLVSDSKSFSNFLKSSRDRKGSRSESLLRCARSLKPLASACLSNRTARLA